MNYALRVAKLQMRTAYVEPMLALVRACGGDAETLASTYGASASSMSLARFKAFQNAASRAAGDPFLGLHAVALLPRGTFGIIELLVRHSATAREGFQRMARFSSYFSELTIVTFEETSEHGYLQHQVAGVDECLGRQGNEFFIGMLVFHGTRFAGCPLIPTRIWFAHQAPDDLGELQRFFGTTEFHFGAGFNRVEFPRAWLDLPLRESAPPLVAALEKQAEHALALGSAPTNIVERAHAIASQQLFAGTWPSLESVASVLAVSPRTLQRRFADAGTTFFALMDGVREHFARMQIAAGDRSVKEVAALLGYADVSQFTRAFRRWTGLAPTQYRGK
jgi:AraC-like DNA-binding protein